METKVEGEWRPFPINENVAEVLKDAAIKIDFDIKPCAGGHKVDGKTPMLQDYQFNGRTCDCNRMIYKVEGCGCGGKERELHGYPNQ